METFLVAVFSYFCGSIPFGLILTKFFSGKDIRSIGSKNIGATNVLRTGNKYLAFTTLILDILKGYFVVIIAQQYFSELIQLSALLVFLGHLFPIWLKFKGGKGVATFIGILFALSYSLTLLFILTWITVALIFKYSSLSSIFASITVFVISFIKENVIKAFDPNISNVSDIKLLLFIFLILIIYTHKNNIFNLINRTELKIKL
ncbi:MAG: glycerol-3-phosphate 1-O-acyltransferase PlsY [Pelagibacteraceae bacterium]|nr:glycerol-3-phosphate 1-O-acyltransferase PlsY [Pelagibacteraceae bacterium]